MKQLSSMARNKIFDLDLNKAMAELVITTAETQWYGTGDRQTHFEGLRFWTDEKGMRELAAYAAKIADELAAVKLPEGKT